MPETPAGLSATVNEKTGVVHLNWGENTEQNFRYYTIYRGTENPPTTHIGITWGENFWDPFAKGGCRYFYAVSAVSYEGSTTCEAVAVTIPLQEG